MVEVVAIDHEEGTAEARAVEPPELTVAIAALPDRPVALGDRLLVRIQRRGKMLFGEIMRRLGQPVPALLGRVERSGKSFVLRATDKRVRDDYLLTELRGAAPGDLVRARISHLRRAGKGLAEVVEVIGPAAGPHAPSAIAIAEQDIPVEFSAAALAEAAAARPADLTDRIDLRSVPFVTIDGADARDFDDAVFARPQGDGFTVMIGIADVSWYVRPGSALDRAAYERGNSVYFPDRVVPMLPERLSNDLCSLRPDEDKAALVCTITFDREGKELDHRFERALIRSAARLTYERAQAVRDHGRADGVPDHAVELVRNLYAAWAAVSHARRQRAPLDLDLAERQIVLARDGRVQAIATRARLDSHRLIEDFMIAANVAAAERLASLSVIGLNRIHDPPDPVRVENLRTVLENLGQRFAKGQVLSAGQFNRILAWAAETPWRQLVNDAVLRTQSLAVYGPADRGHFGLALRRYAHFTSPIRRYADLVVHRAIVHALGLGPGGLFAAGPVDLDEIGDHISATERRATAAERAAADRFVALFLSDRVGGRFAARISATAPFGVFITLDETGADALVPLARLPGGPWRHDAGQMALVDRHGEILRPGVPVIARLDVADTLTGGLLCTVLDYETGPAPSRAGRKPAPRKGQRRPRGRR